MQDLIADFHCPQCNRKVKIKVKEMIPGTRRRLGCGCTIRFTGDDGRKMQRALDELERKLKRLFR